jgi:hypothetical protein
MMSDEVKNLEYRKKELNALSKSSHGRVCFSALDTETFTCLTGELFNKLIKTACDLIDDEIKKEGYCDE